MDQHSNRFMPTALSSMQRSLADTDPEIAARHPQRDARARPTGSS